MIQEERRLKSLLSKAAYDDYTMKIVSNIHQDIMCSWYAVQTYDNALRDIKRKNPHITAQELAICNAYREAAYRVFYECRELYLDALILSGKMTQVERDESLEYAKKKRYA
jgi:hypothetical protein